MPADAQSVAIVRKNVVVLWAPSGLPGKGGKKPTPKIKEIGDLAGRRVGVIGRTQANVTLLRVILSESGVVPDKVAVTQFGTGQIAEMTKDPAIDAFMTVGPLGSKITAEAIAATARARGEPVFLPIDVSEAIAQRHPLYESEEIPGSSFSSSPARPEDKIDTVSVNHLIVARKSLSETTVGHAGPAIVRRASVAGPGSAGRGAHRKARHRQGRRPARASRCRGLYRRHRAHVPRALQRLLLGARCWFYPGSARRWPGCATI